MNTLKKQLFLLTLSLSTLLPFSGLAMDVDLTDATQAALKATREAQRELTTQEKIDRAKAPIRHSWPMRQISTWLANQMPEIEDNKDFSNHPFKKYAEEAHNELGIPKDEQLPVVVTDYKKDPFLKYLQDAYASCFPKAIAGNQDRIRQNIPMGLHRFSAFHEVAHRKHFDSMYQATILGTSLSLFFCSYFLLGGYIFSKIKVTPYLCGPLYGALLVSTPTIAIDSIQLISKFGEKYSRYCEHRADITAAYGCECHRCVRDRAENRALANEEKRTDSGYASSKEMHQIADELEKINKTCRDHRY